MLGNRPSRVKRDLGWVLIHPTIPLERTESALESILIVIWIDYTTQIIIIDPRLILALIVILLFAYVMTSHLSKNR